MNTIATNTKQIIMICWTKKKETVMLHEKNWKNH